MQYHSTRKTVCVESILGIFIGWTKIRLHLPVKRWTCSWNYCDLHQPLWCQLTFFITKTYVELVRTACVRLSRTDILERVRRISIILKTFGQKQHLSKYCMHCQEHGKSSRRFSFTIKDDIEFNYNVIVNILYIQGKPVLHLIDKATRFQTGRWLKNISTKHVWDQLRVFWIDTYFSPSDLVTVDTNKQIMIKELKQYVVVIIMTIIASKTP